MRGLSDIFTFAASGGSAQANARALPSYPRWDAFTRHLMVSVVTALLLNTVFAIAAVSFYEKVFGDEVQQGLCSLVTTNRDCLSQPVLLFFVSVVFAQVATMLWPTHWAHDIAVQFFNTAELCDRLANEIDGTAYVDPASVQERREWARSIVTNYKYSRLIAKFTLFGINILLAVSILMPWVWAIYHLGFSWWSVIIVSLLIVPAALDIFLEMNSLIWPSKGSSLLLDPQ